MTLKELIKNIQIKILDHSSSEKKINFLRKQGVKIGSNCYIETMKFSTEPFLIEIGDHVAISYGTAFVTHDGGAWCFQDDLSNCMLYSKIKIGNNVFIGFDCTILLNTTIGNNCIIGAGSVVRGNFPDNSVIIGNPAKVVMTSGVQKFLFKNNPGLLKTRKLPQPLKNSIVRQNFGIE